MARLLAAALLVAFSAIPAFAQDDTGSPGDERFNSNDGQAPDPGSPPPYTSSGWDNPAPPSGDPYAPSSGRVPVAPCGMNGLEAQAWSGEAANAMLGMIGPLIDQGCRGRAARAAAAPCMIEVAFEPVASGLGVARALHAVVVLREPSGASVAFEGNPSGTFPQWGTLRARMRRLRIAPLKPDSVVKPAGHAADDCRAVAAQVNRLDANLAASGLPYTPAPEIAWNAVNSNSYAYWIVTQLGLSPPVPSPWEGSALGYNPSIQP